MSKDNPHISGRYTIMAAIIAGVFGVLGIILKSYLDNSNNNKLNNELVDYVENSDESNGKVVTSKITDKTSNFLDSKKNFETIEYSELKDKGLMDEFTDSINYLPNFHLIENINKEGYPNEKLEVVYYIKNIINPLTGENQGDWYLFNYDGKWSYFSEDKQLFFIEE